MKLGDLGGVWGLRFLGGILFETVVSYLRDTLDINDLILFARGSTFPSKWRPGRRK